MESKIVKIVNCFRRDLEDKKDLAARDMWRDKRVMILDANGTLYNLPGWRIDQAPKRVMDKVIDLT